MKLSMWIFSDWLKEYQPSIQIKNGGLTIHTIRLFSNNSQIDPGSLYIGRLDHFFAHGDNRIFCAHNNDLLILHTENLEDVLNSILCAMDFYAHWNSDMLELLSSGCMVSELLRRSEAVINEPIFLLDSSQRVLAMSSQFASGEVDSAWDQMQETKSADFQQIMEFNQQYSSIMKERELYRFGDGGHVFSENPVYGYNFFLNDSFVGVVNLIDRNNRISQGQLDLFSLLCHYLERWFETHAQQQSILLLDSLLHQIFSGQESDYISLKRQFHRIGWQPESQKLLLLLSNVSDQFNTHAHFCHTINASLPACYAFVHDSNVCILCNLNLLNIQLLFPELERLSRQGGYYGCYGDVFSDFQQLPEAFSQAFLTISFCEKQIGHFYHYQDYALHYGFSMIREHMHTRFVHPAVSFLQNYDKRHHTALGETLHAYLTMERSPSKTADYLNIHRHTLDYRLKRIYDLTGCDLTDAEVRLHLLCSYSFLEFP